MATSLSQLTRTKLKPHTITIIKNTQIKSKPYKLSKELSKI